MKLYTSKPYLADNIFKPVGAGGQSMQVQVGAIQMSPGGGGAGLKKLGSLDSNSSLISRPKSPGLVGDRSFRMVGSLGTNATLRRAKSSRSVTGSRQAMARRGMS